MICTIDIRCNAAHPEMPLMPFVAFRTSPSSVRILDVPKKIGNWNITQVLVKVQYPDNSYSTKSCVRSGNVWVGTLDGTDITGTVTSGFTIGANGVDENGDEVNGYILGVGDVRIMDVDGSITPGDTTWAIHLYDSPPDNPRKGDAYIEFYDTSYVLWIFDGASFIPAGYTQLTGYIHHGDNVINEPLKIEYKDRQTLQFDNKGISLSSKTYAHSCELRSNSLSIGLGDTAVSRIAVGNGIKIESLRLGDSPDSYRWVNKMQIDGKDVALASEVEDRLTSYVSSNAMPINGKETGLFRLGTEDYGVEWSSKGGYLGVYGSGNSVWLDNGTFVELDSGWDQLKKIVSAKPLQHQTLPEYLSANYVLSSNVHNNTITFTQGGVEKGSFNLNQGTDKTIELDAGGGGSSKCLMNVSGIAGSTQYVSWTSGSDTFKIMRSDSHRLKLLKNGVEQTGYYGLTPIITEVDGNVSIYDNGYPYETNVFLDNVRQSSYSPLNTTGKKILNICMDECLEQSTPITMADGTTKMICELSRGDKVLSLNPDTLQLEEDEVLDCDAGMMKMSNKMDVWNFADGTTIKTIKPHQFYNVRTGRMEYIADFMIGDGVRKQDGTTTTLLGHETKYGVYFHNTLYTKKYNNYFANGILTGNRHSVKWGWYWKKTNA